MDTRMQTLVDIYVSEIRVLAVKAEAGALVEERVREVVQEAASRFVTETEAPRSDLEALAGRLAIGVRPGAHPSYKRTIRLARQLARQKCRAFA
jgi:Flp pilus assembly protein CpaB